MNNISQLVRDLLSKTNISSFPIPLSKIAKGIGVIIKPLKLEDNISGFLYLKEDKPIIFVNSKHPKTRRRFTVAHEIGHFLLNHNGELFVDIGYFIYRDSRSKDGNIRQEKEANKFAAELLMPEEMFTNELFKSDIDLEDFDELNKFAARLVVSIQALSIRLSNLG